MIGQKRKNRILALIYIISLILLANNIISDQTTSTNYDQNVVISDGGGNVSSNTYKQDIIIGEIIGETTSETKKSHLGFFHSTGQSPNITLFRPLNDSYISVPWALLNASVLDPDNQNIDVYFWGANSTEQMQNGDHSLLKIYKDVSGTSSGVELTYNWNSTPIQPDDNLVLLMHLDNRSEFGESDIDINDFSIKENDGTNNDAIFNSSGGKFAGAFRFNGTDSYIEVTDPADDSLDVIGNLTIALWFRPLGTPNVETLISKNYVYNEFDIEVRRNSIRLYHGNGTDYEAALTYTRTSNWEGGRWYFIALVRDNSTKTVTYYEDGNYYDDDNFDLDPTASDYSVTIGVRNLAKGRAFNGTIDEVAIWKRSLSATEIKNLYQLRSSRYYWKVNATDASKNPYNSEKWEFTIDATAPKINSSINDTAPRRYELVNISGNFSDEYQLRLCQFTNNQTGLKVYENQTITGTWANCWHNFTVNEPRGTVINFSVIGYDLANNTNQTDYILTVENTPPPQVTLRTPETMNQTINRTPIFNWNNVTDADNDSLSFNLIITCVTCSDDNRNVNVSTLNYTPQELLYLWDEKYFYNWSVRAIDNSSRGVTSHGRFSEVRNISINSYVSINTSVSTVNFGTVGLGDVDDTTDNTPNPIVLENWGNVFVNVTIYAEDNLWESAPNPTNNFRYKVDNTTEGNALNWTESNYNWTMLYSSANRSINNFNYRDNNDTVEVDLYINVPSAEPAGTKSSKIVFEAERA